MVHAEYGSGSACDVSLSAEQPSRSCHRGSGGLEGLTPILTTGLAPRDAFSMSDLAPEKRGQWTQEHTLPFGKARSHFGAATWLLETASRAGGVATTRLPSATRIGKPSANKRAPKWRHSLRIGFGKSHSCRRPGAATCTGRVRWCADSPGPKSAKTSASVIISSEKHLSVDKAGELLRRTQQS